MKAAKRVLAVILALLVIGGGLAISSLSSPMANPEQEQPEPPVLTDRPGEAVSSRPEQAEKGDITLIDPEASPAPQLTPEPEATPEPTPETEIEIEPVTTPEPSPEPTAEPTAEDNEPLPASFFDDAAFVGDSVSGVLEYYGANNEGLGKAEFFVNIDLTVKDAAEGTEPVYYKNQALSVPEALKAAGAKKVYIMLGSLGDLPNRSIDETISNWEKLIDKIRDKSPEIKIFIESCTPVAYDVPKINNAMIDDYNARLKDFAAQNGCVYVEIGAHFKDASGKLPFEHCRDGYASLRIDSASLWVEQLKDPANYSANPRTGAAASQAVKEASFTVEGMTITLTSEFQKIEMAGFTAAFDSPDVGLLATKELFSAAEGLAGLTVEEYIDLVISGNGIQGAEKQSLGGVPSFCYSYTNPQDAASYRYFSFVYKTGDAFWLLQFVTAEGNAPQYEAKIADWAKSVRFA